MDVKEISQEEFVDIITTNNIVVIDCWATWCAPCKSFGEIFAEIARNYPSVLFCKLNIENNEDFIKDLAITSVPTVLDFGQNYPQISDN